MIYNVLRYNNIGELCDRVTKTCHVEIGTRHESAKWKGADSMQQAIERVRASYVPQNVLNEVNRIVSSIDASIHERTKPEWMPDVMGAYPMVPDYLMGMPESMRMRHDIESEFAPVRIIVETGFAAVASEDTIQRYGAAITALAMILSETRAVELWVFDSTVSGDFTNTIAIKMDQPFNVAQCAMAMATPVIGRMVALNLVFSEAKLKGARPNHSLGFGYGAPSEARANVIRKAYGFEPSDVVIQTKLIPDDAMLKSDPVKWVHKQLEKQRHTAE